jgi:hypothetical protein
MQGNTSVLRTLADRDVRAPSAPATDLITHTARRHVPLLHQAHQDNQPCSGKSRNLKVEFRTQSDPQKKFFPDMKCFAQYSHSPSEEGKPALLLQRARTNGGKL